MPVAVRQRIEEAAMPCLPRFKGDLETEPAVGIYRFRRRARRGNRHCAAKVTVSVGVTQMLVRFRPLRRDPTSADNTPRFYLEDVREVAAEHDLELKPDRIYTIVGDVQVFVHAAADRSADGKAECARRNRIVFRQQ